MLLKSSQKQIVKKNFRDPLSVLVLLARAVSCGEAIGSRKASWLFASLHA